MPANPLLFAGLDFGSGRKPVTLAALDDDLQVTILEKLSITETLACFDEYQEIRIGINTSLGIHSPAYSEFKEKLTRAGFRPAGRQDSPRQWFSTDAKAFFIAFSGEHLLARRTLEGRIQRALLLYHQDLQISDPMDVFEEITRYKLMQGILPLEIIYSSRELDALAAAYVAWMMINRPARIAAKDGVILPVGE